MKNKSNSRSFNLKYKPITEYQNYLKRLSFETGITISGSEPFAKMEYDDELLAKDRALSSYFYEINLPVRSFSIVRSPLPRHYRTTTKRRIHNHNGKILLSSEEISLSDTPSLLEPEIHSKIYSFLSKILNKKENIRYALDLNFIIIRGNYEKIVVIFNIKKVDGNVIRTFTAIASNLAEDFSAIDGAFLFVDPEGSKYYMNFSSETDGPKFKRLFGNRYLSVKVNDVLYKFSPECFSQVNLSICSDMLNAAVKLLAPNGNRLFDLYCGYGFFSCFLSQFYESLTGVDYLPASIDSARDNMERLNIGKKYNFFAKKIDPRNLSQLLPDNLKNDHVLLDPPKNGTAPGVIEFIASRNPESVLHIFCGLETIPAEIERWEKYGYMPEKCQPLDMFPGTSDIEVMLLLKNHSSKTPSRLKSGR